MGNSLVLEDIIFELIIFQKTNPNIYIGGSIALMLQKTIPQRIPKDIDIISKENIHIYDIFNIDKFKHPKIKLFKRENLKYELFINKNTKYINFNYQGNNIKITPVEEILDWKLKYQKRNPNNLKNNNDIIEIGKKDRN